MSPELQRAIAIADGDAIRGTEEYRQSLQRSFSKHPWPETFGQLQGPPTLQEYIRQEVEKYRCDCNYRDPHVIGENDCRPLWRY